MKIKYTSVLLLALLFSCLTTSAQSWLWGVEGGSSLKADVYPSNVATNKTGNVYQSGGFVTSLSLGAYNLNSIAEEDVFLVKYDQNGNVLWANQSAGDENSYALGYSVATDDSDNSYITGFATDISGYGLDTVAFGPHILYLPGLGDFFLVKYNSNGSLVWVTTPDTSTIADGTEGWDVTTDKFNHEYVTGDGAFLIKYDRNGKVIWAVPQTTDTFGSYNIGYSVATDISGNVYMAGTFIDSLQFGAQKLYSQWGDIFIAKFDSNGHALWAQQSNNSNYYNNYFGPSVAVGESGTVYLTSSFSDSITFNSYTFVSDTVTSFFILKYSPNGTIAWGNEGVPLNDTYCGSYSVCTDDSNHVYITGEEENYSSASSFVFANYTSAVAFSDTDLNDIPSFLLKLDSLGNVLCGSTLPVGGLEANTVTSDSTGKFVYMGGIFVNSFGLGNDTLINNTGGTDTYVGRWKSCEACDLTPTVTPQSPSICIGQSVTLTAGGGLNYTWSPAQSLSSSSGDTVIATPTIQTTYTIAATNSSGCTGSVNDIVYVSSPPDTPTISQHKDTLISSAKQGNQWVRNDTTLQGATNQTYIVTISGEYKVITENPANGCSSTSGANYYTPTGIKQLKVGSGQCAVYPNPTGGEIFININSSVADVNTWNLKLIDMLGRPLYTMPSLNYSNEIDLSNLPNGIYFISVTNNLGTTVVPVVKGN